MTLPANCDWCGHPLMPWDDDEDTICGGTSGTKGCGSTVKTWEHLTFAETQRRIHLIKRREQWGAAVDRAESVEVSGDVL